jgi:hypothetical protein
MSRDGCKVKAARNVREIYPSRFATSRVYPNESHTCKQPSPEDAETAAVKCAQCGAPIEDSNSISSCWNCGSDNFLGAFIGRRW